MLFSRIVRVGAIVAALAVAGWLLAQSQPPSKQYVDVYKRQCWDRSSEDLFISESAVNLLGGRDQILSNTLELTHKFRRRPRFIWDRLHGEGPLWRLSGLHLVFDHTRVGGRLQSS